jgi:alpha-amylase
MHETAMQTYFGVTPTVFRNTELAYNNDLGRWVEDAGYKAVLTEGWDPVLNWRSSHYLYSPMDATKTALFLKDYRLSDDLAFRFSNRQWAEWPLTSEKYMGWIDALPAEETLINLFMDFETFGEHQWADTGIFDFVEKFFREWCAAGNRSVTFSEALARHPIHDSIDMPSTVTWADNERDLSAWTGNAMQQEAVHALYGLEDAVLRTSDDALIRDWRLLQTSDHLYYLSTKWFDDGNVHAYFSPYDSPYDGFLCYLNAIRDIRYRVFEHGERRLSPHE